MGRFDNFNPKALMIGINTCEMAVGQQSGGVVAADELELFPIAHDELRVFLCWLSGGGVVCGPGQDGVSSASSENSIGEVRNIKERYI